MKEKLLIGITANKKTVSVNFSLKQDVTSIADVFLDLSMSYDNVIPIIIYQEKVEHVERICRILNYPIISSREEGDPIFYDAINLFPLYKKS